MSYGIEFSWDYRYYAIYTIDKRANIRRGADSPTRAIDLHRYSTIEDAIRQVATHYPLAEQRRRLPY